MATLPPVTVVCANASSNSLGRALLLAELLRTETRVQIAGVRNADRIWGPAEGSGIPVRSFRVPAHAWELPRAVPWLREVAGDDAVIVSKTVAHSLGLAAAARIGRRGLLVDIDDWESGLRQRGSCDEHMSGLRQAMAVARSFAARGGLNAFTATRAMETLARRYPHHVVSNRWLERRFGGDVLYHVRDPAVLDPARAPTRALPALPPEATWVGFVGTPRAHKGISVLARAVELARREADVGLIVMGVDRDDEPTLVDARQRLGGDRFRTLPQFPFDALADHVRLADIIALPSLDTPAAWGQIPAKLFDGMSMAKPIVATAVNDMPEIVEGAGLVVPPGDAPALAHALVTLAKDPALRARLGRRGREKLVAEYSYDAGRKVLVRALERALVR